MTEPEAQIVEAWRDLLDRHARAMGSLERRLEEEHGLGVSEYEVLERLAEGPADQRRMQELAASVHLSQSATGQLPVTNNNDYRAGPGRWFRRYTYSRDYRAAERDDWSNCCGRQSTGCCGGGGRPCGGRSAA